MNDTVAHENNLAGFQFSEEDLSIRFVQENVDIRGILKFDNSLESSSYSLMYDGSAGIAGIAAQFAVHSVLESGAQGRRMTKAQIKANRLIATLISVAEGLSNSELLRDREKKTQDTQL